MRIAIDGIAVSHPQPGGYRTYATNLVEHLAREGREHAFVLFLDRPIALDLPPNWHTRVISRAVPGVGVPLREQVGLPLQARRCNADVLHSLCGTGPVVSPWPRIVTLLDTIEFSSPLHGLDSMRAWATRLYNRVIQRRMMYSAKAVITISQYSKECIAQRFEVGRDRIFVIYLAPAAHFLRSERHDSAKIVQDAFGLSNYVLAFASASLRKNIERLLKSYELLAPSLRSMFGLVIVCAHPRAKERLASVANELDIRADVVLLDRVANGQLVALVSAAALFVFPSLEEGFGLPPLEAMACGTPVVASNTSSMPEVLGDAAMLVDPKDTQALSNAIAAMLDSRSLREEYVHRGLRRSREFSWARTAEQTIAIYEGVAHQVRTHQ